MNNFWQSWPIIMKFEMEHPYGQGNSPWGPDMVFTKSKMAAKMAADFRYLAITPVPFGR